MVILVGVVLYLTFTAGESLEGKEIGKTVARVHAGNTIDFLKAINVRHSMSILILQILVIVVISRVLGRLMSLIGQPTVIGEIIAGIMLGPSLLGMFFPEVSSFLFPAESLSNLQFLSQIGLMLFMFIIGMELDMGIIKQRAKAALFISNTSIIVPYLMGVVMSYYLYERFAPRGADFISFALFMGIAMSITAFPVLARIVQERGITRTPIGTIVITSAAINDITAWGILAVVVAIANATAITGALITILLSLVFIFVMLLGVKPLLEKLAVNYTVQETVSKTIVAAVFSVMLISSFITESIGIHALFGAFMAGVIMPQNIRFKAIMAEKMEDVSLVLLLPLFFVYTGLRTEIGLLNDNSLWNTAWIVILVAVAGKFAGSAIATRLTGQSWKNSLTVGALMNTRGLIELVALNIGYDIGILSPEIFTILVLMALITTFMTGPAMSLINYIYRAKESLATVSGLFKVLISFGPPLSGARLLTLVNRLFSREKDHLSVTALHLTPNTEISKESALLFEEQAFRPINEIAREENLDVKTEYRTTQSVSQEITRTANRGKYNLLIVGSSRPLLSSDKTGGKARYFFENVKSDVALVIDNGFKDINRVLIVCMDDPSREYMYTVAARFNEHISTDIECLKDRKDLEHDYTQYDLIITGLECYRIHRQAATPWTLGPVSIIVFSRYE
ncbi:MAG TPA: cation:proton antiporter [Lentimicrobium sp.]|nr:cation:proton antiporter [Lentimicrobium sp.]